jgi:hypothetical protein
MLDKKKNLRKILLPPFAVFGEWSSLYEEYLMSSSASLKGLSEESLDESLHSNAELLRVENRSRSSMRSAIMALEQENIFDVSSAGPSGSNKTTAKVLPEHLRACGLRSGYQDPQQPEQCRRDRGQRFPVSGGPDPPEVDPRRVRPYRQRRPLEVTARDCRQRWWHSPADRRR